MAAGSSVVEDLRGEVRGRSGDEETYATYWIDGVDGGGEFGDGRRRGQGRWGGDG
jgi:hypothetical protein